MNYPRKKELARRNRGKKKGKGKKMHMPACRKATRTDSYLAAACRRRRSEHSRTGKPAHKINNTPIPLLFPFLSAHIAPPNSLSLSKGYTHRARGILIPYARFPRGYVTLVSLFCFTSFPCARSANWRRSLGSPFPQEKAKETRAEKREGEKKAERREKDGTRATTGRSISRSLASGEM